MKRISSVDVFRGIALLQMIFWQILDFFLSGNIYTDAPYYFQPFNMPINGIGVGLFAFIAGFGVYFSFSKRSKLNAIKHALKRYGGYIVISLLFTSFVFSFSVFYQWNEVVQGIGLSGLVGFILLLLTKSKMVLGLISAVLILFQQTILNFTYQLPSEGILGFVINLLFRGYFSIINILPFILVGIIVAFFFFDKKIKLLFFSSILIIVLSIFLHTFGFGIDYYNRSSTYIIFYIGLSVLVLSIIEIVLKKSKNFVLFRPLKTLGKGAFLGYLVHFLFIYKPSIVFGFNSIFDFYPSLLLTIISTIIIYFLIRVWLNLKEKRSWKVLWI